MSRGSCTNPKRNFQIRRQEFMKYERPSAPIDQTEETPRRKQWEVDPKDLEIGRESFTAKPDSGECGCDREHDDPIPPHKCTGVDGAERHGTANQCKVCGRYSAGYHKGCPEPPSSADGPSDTATSRRPKS